MTEFNFPLYVPVIKEMMKVDNLIELIKIALIFIVSRMINKEEAFVWLLVGQFWLSGLFVLSVIFLNIQDLDDLTLLTFLGYSLGSFSAGILSDIVGRRWLFIICSCILFLSSLILLWDLSIGFILANLCIGPLNNLTFVFINQNYPKKSELTTVKVLVGWALSEITLGLFFLITENQNAFFYCLVVFSFVYAVGAVLLTKETQQFIDKRQMLRQRSIKEILLPKQIMAIIGGSILMFMMQMFYYRTQFTLDRFGISLQVNTIVVGVVQAIANISFFRFVKNCRRKLLLQLLICSLMLLLFALIMVALPEVQTTIEGLMRLCDTCIMLVLGVYLPELFQMSDRGKGTNYIMCFGVFGSALSGKVFSHLQFAYLEIFLFVALASSCLMPETKIDQPKSQSLLEKVHDSIQT